MECKYTPLHPINEVDILTELLNFGVSTNKHNILGIGIVNLVLIYNYILPVCLPI